MTQPAMLRKVLAAIVLIIALAIAASSAWDAESAPFPEPPAPDPLHAAVAQLPRAPPPPLAAPARELDASAAPPEPRAEVDAGTPTPPVVLADPPDSGAPPVAPPEPAVTFSIDAGARVPNDPRFTIRWGQEGLCGDEPLARLAERRAALLATFASVRRAGTLITFDPDAPSSFVDQAGASLADARVIVTRLLGPAADVALPVIYVYASGEQMRDVACVNTATAGYYDGAIHLPATDPDSWRTIVHEHVHHVLNTLGVRKPMWLHEGLAMYAADERWWEDPRLGLTTWLRAKHLPFPALVEAFPHTADELFAGAAYYQSYQMVSFVSVRSGRADFAWLVDGLVSGRLPVQTAFGDGVGLTEDQLESAWQAFIQSR